VCAPLRRTQPGGHGHDGTVVITGNRVSVDTARLLVESQLEFERQLSSERDRQMDLVRKLNAMDVQYGDRVRVLLLRAVLREALPATRFLGSQVVVDG